MVAISKDLIGQESLIIFQDFNSNHIVESLIALYWGKLIIIILNMDLNKGSLTVLCQEQVIAIITFNISFDHIIKVSLSFFHFIKEAINSIKEAISNYNLATKESSANSRFILIQAFIIRFDLIISSIFFPFPFINFFQLFVDPILLYTFVFIQVIKSLANQYFNDLSFDENINLYPELQEFAM